MKDKSREGTSAARPADNPVGWAYGPSCTGCGGVSARAVRTHSAEVRGEAVYYLTYVWACSVCGEEWLDDGLSRLNQWSADSARLSAGRPERWRAGMDGETSAES